MMMWTERARLMGFTDEDFAWLVLHTGIELDDIDANGAFILLLCNRIENLEAKVRALEWRGE